MVTLYCNEGATELQTTPPLMRQRRMRVALPDQPLALWTDFRNSPLHLSKEPMRVIRDMEYFKLRLLFLHEATSSFPG